MSNLETISIKVGEREREFIHEIAAHFKLYKRSSTDLSYTKALQFLIEFCLQNEINPTKKDDNNIAEMRKMIEQIHASIPHILFQNQFQSLILANKLMGEDIGSVKQSTIQYLNDNFSGFQNITYKDVKAKINGIGLKTLPLEQGVSIWK